MTGRFIIGVALGVALGGIVAVALLPEPRKRFRELGARLAEVDGLGAGVERVARLGRRALAEAQARYELALAAAREAREAAQRELWAQLEAARRQGQLPPG